MQSTDFVLETLSHFVRRTDGPPPGIPVRTEPNFEQELTWLCEWHALTPIVLASLEKLALRPQLSRITLERMKALANASIALSDDLLEIAASLSTLFEKRALERLFLGDVIFRNTMYPDPVLRPMERIDILVHEEDWSAVLGVCREAGFRLDDRLPAFDDGGEALLYYQHYAPCVLENEKGDRLGLRMRVFELGEADLSETAWDQGRELTQPFAQGVGTEDQLIHSCLTYNMTDFRKLLHAVDIGLVLNRYGNDLDWAYIEDRLRSRSVYPAVFFTLKNVVRWLKLDQSGIKLDSPGAVRRKYFDFLWHVNYDSFAMRRPERLHRLRFCLLEAGRWSDKLRFLATLLSPKREWVSAFFDRPYRPWLKLKFVVLTFKSQVGARLTGNP
jgi:hypothetical protein